MDNSYYREADEAATSDFEAAAKAVANAANIVRQGHIVNYFEDQLTGIAKAALEAADDQIADNTPTTQFVYIGNDVARFGNVATAAATPSTATAAVTPGIATAAATPSPTYMPVTDDEDDGDKGDVGVNDDRALDIAVAEDVNNDRALNIHGNPMEEDNQDQEEDTMMRVEQDQAGTDKKKMQTRYGTRGIVDEDLERLKARATAWVEELFLNDNTSRAVLKIIDNFTYWDQQFSSHTMVRKLRKQIEKIGSIEAAFTGIVSDESYLTDHYLKCRIIAISAMVDPEGISIPYVFYGYRTANDEISKKWVDLLTQIQTLLHWTSNQRVRSPYMAGLTMPYKATPKATARSRLPASRARLGRKRLPISRPTTVDEDHDDGPRRKKTGVAFDDYNV